MVKLGRKTKLWCTECYNSFYLTGPFDWQEIKCEDCGFTGPVVGTVKNGEEIYFTDVEETTELPKVRNERTVHD